MWLITSLSIEPRAAWDITNKSRTVFQECCGFFGWDIVLRYPDVPRIFVIDQNAFPCRGMSEPP